ncbi:MULTISPECIES: ribosome silencing factor [Flavobacterium]|jgi:ribosome-associated protein|uniref:Ribosomal silencing factor RsfS n=1 Tax=Flavobacterium supellecticarium TaxID=2565924 RepID=A0A4S4A4K0_9FLAO|nr:MULTISPECIES: ribosome silencing factor [Flavobacterium]MPT36551.1 ribosome silencing factor [Flavobacterium sp.]THF53410.1 ribosome silencing factor [Flavobacterium supellecticarium]HRB72065.1 ribosome silencing factor [Flavobacterium sp.]
MAKKDNINNDDLLANIIKGVEEVKGNDIDILDLRAIENTVCDYFVICNGNSNTQVNAIANSVQKIVSKELKDKPWHVEGAENGEWILMDYVTIVVHVFQKHIREYYNIESLWGDAKITSIQNKY